MRFIENGPSIPDALLYAQDEGRVVFFCGAGVSRARAGLPGFFGLAESVLERLGVDESHQARKVLSIARKLGKELDVTGLVSADQIFGLLERDFAVGDIQNAVAICLKPREDVDVSAHKTLIQLATTSESRLQLVTTNFDRLFEIVDSRITIYQPPRLPNPIRYDDFDGLVYLHGRVDQEYCRPDGQGLVVSSADFGYAYLSEGWAADFIREIVRKYVVVFVGYSADDPPARYLLEGLSRRKGASQQIYAFQSNEQAELVFRWQHKGVTAIPYDSANSHETLWQTLDSWADRTSDPKEWRATVLEKAKLGPEKLSASERGQVAHIVSTDVGAREFAERAPPAQWICVFDSACRFGTPESADRYDPTSQIIDPFGIFGLDSDALPTIADVNNPYSKRAVPVGAWDAFEWNFLDLANVTKESLPSARGAHSRSFPKVAPRIAFLGHWLSTVAHEPAAVWWAARQGSLHLRFAEDLRWRIEQGRHPIPTVLKEAWLYLLEAFECNSNRREFFSLTKEIEKCGWCQRKVRTLIELHRPCLAVEPALMAGTVPPTELGELRLWDFIRPKVLCTVFPNDLSVPDDWLATVIGGMRKNIELAVQLSKEVHDFAFDHLSPIIPDDDPDISSVGRTDGPSGCVIQFASMYKRLADLDPASARREFASWPVGDDTAFSRLRVWASGTIGIFNVSDFANELSNLSDDAFWDSRHQRDFLHCTQRRWQDLDDDLRRKLEDRLLHGPSQYEGEDDEQFNERRSWSILNRVKWLELQGCKFESDIESEFSRLRQIAPKWKPETAEGAADSLETRAGFVRVDTEPSELLKVPIDEILDKAKLLGDRTDSWPLEEREPFRGLCASHPRRAFLALKRRADKGDFPAWAWKTYLSSETRKADSNRLILALANRICVMPNETVVSMLYMISMWFEKAAKKISAEQPHVYESVVSKLISVVETKPDVGASIVLSSSHGSDLVTNAINSSTGHVTMAVLNDVRLDNLQDDGLAQNAFTLPQLERLLQLTATSRYCSVVIMCHSLAWLYRVAKVWTTEKLLSILERPDELDKEALWAGFLWNPQISSVEFFSFLKPGLLKLSKQHDLSRRTNTQSLAIILLRSWFWSLDPKKPSFLSDVEFREILLHSNDEFRSHVLWQIERYLREREPTNEQLPFDVRRFFADVWPKQKTVRTHEMTKQLCRLLLVDVEVFRQLNSVVFPFLTRFQDGVYVNLDLHDGIPETAMQMPNELVELLWKVLPENVGFWPYGIGKVLQNLSDSDSKSTRSKPMAELLRKWQSR